MVLAISDLIISVLQLWSCSVLPGSCRYIFALQALGKVQRQLSSSLKEGTL